MEGLLKMPEARWRLCLRETKRKSPSVVLIGRRRYRNMATVLLTVDILRIVSDLSILTFQNIGGNMLFSLAVYRHLSLFAELEAFSGRFYRHFLEAP